MLQVCNYLLFLFNRKKQAKLKQELEEAAREPVKIRPEE
jgi:hypothetical protein